ncbi:MAG: hypothetical protein OXQ29_03730 [Rhodospirillaceae bacterium]|nr:hypothetical protein [Rhodospirillaceae bacterium]
MARDTLDQVTIICDVQEVPVDGFEAWCQVHDVHDSGGRGWCSKRQQWVYPGWVMLNFDGDCLGYWPREAIFDD